MNFRVTICEDMVRRLQVQSSVQCQSFNDEHFDSITARPICYSREPTNMVGRDLKKCAVYVALGYGLDDQGSRVRFPAGAWNFSLHHRIHNGSGAHPASYPMGTRCSFPGGKAAGS
jgi:hypothetical protein